MTIRPAEKSTRIAKIIADAGYCSRRQAEELILEGRVQVNGKLIDTPAILITDESIKIDNKLINPKQDIRLWLFNKPSGFLTTTFDPKNRKNIFDILPQDMPRVISVGRLDYNSEGLLLLTTNGDLARYMELPKTGWIRKYRVRAHGKINEERLQKLTKGIVVDGTKYRFSEIIVESMAGTNAWLKISLKEGKNREIRKVLEHLGLKVNRLIRVSYGSFNLGNLASGQVLEVTKKQLQSFLPKELL